MTVFKEHQQSGKKGMLVQIKTEAGGERGERTSPPSLVVACMTRAQKTEQPLEKLDASDFPRRRAE